MTSNRFPKHPTGSLKTLKNIYAENSMLFSHDWCEIVLCNIIKHGYMLRIKYDQLDVNHTFSFLSPKQKCEPLQQKVHLVIHPSLFWDNEQNSV